MVCNAGAYDALAHEAGGIHWRGWALQLGMQGVGHDPAVGAAKRAVERAHTTSIITCASMCRGAAADSRPGMPSSDVASMFAGMAAVVVCTLASLCAWVEDSSSSVRIYIIYTYIYGGREVSSYDQDPRGLWVIVPPENMSYLRI